MAFKHIAGLAAKEPNPVHRYSAALVLLNPDGSERFVTREHFASKTARDAWIGENKIYRRGLTDEKRPAKYVKATWLLVDKTEQIDYLEN